MAHPKLHYALDSTNRIIHVQSASRHEEFKCPYCGGSMIVKQGKIRQWHFAHKVLSENCSYESYLHALAKIKIHDWFYHTDKLMLKLNTTYQCSQIDNCIWYNRQNPDYCLTERPIPINLKTFYNACDIERTYRNFRADLFLYNNQSNRDPIFIEICVNHPCSDEKIESGIRIIELFIQSEKDIETVINKTLTENDIGLRLFNFHPKPKITSSCHKN